MLEPLARRLSRLGSSGHIKVGSRLAGTSGPGVAVSEWSSTSLELEAFGDEPPPEDQSSAWEADKSGLSWTASRATSLDER